MGDPVIPIDRCVTDRVGSCSYLGGWLASTVTIARSFARTLANSLCPARAFARSLVRSAPNSLMSFRVNPRPLLFDCTLQPFINYTMKKDRGELE